MTAAGFEREALPDTHLARTSPSVESVETDVALLGRTLLLSPAQSLDVPAASMPADWLVARRVKEEQTLVDRIQDVKASNLAMLRCEWQNARERSDVGVRQMQESKKISAEMEQGQKELLALRQARMKEFLAAEAQECAPRRAQPTASRAPPAHRPPQPAGLSSS